MKDAYNEKEGRVWDSNRRNVHAQPQVVQRRGWEEGVKISSFQAEHRGMRRDPEHLEKQ